MPAPADGLLEAELQARVAAARGPWDEGVWRLALGEPEAGLDAIRAALPAVLSGRPTLLVVQLAVVAGDDQAAERAAREVLTASIGTYVAGYRELAAAMMALVAGDDAEAARRTAALDAYASTHDKLGSHPAAVASMPRGLLERDAPAVAASLDALLESHLRRSRARSETFNSAFGVVSIDAVVALLLAHRRGLNVPVQQRYRAARLPLLTIGVTEWEGRPLARATPLEIVADLVAGPWLRARGVAIEDPVAAAEPARTTRRARTPSVAAIDENATEKARRALAGRLAGPAHPWQRASWALMLGEVAQARDHLREAAADAHGRWHDAPTGGRSPLAWLRRAPASMRPNPNAVREELGYALVAGDRRALGVAARVLRESTRSQAAGGDGAYGHAAGHLDLIADLLDAVGGIGSGAAARPSRAAVEQTGGPHGATRVAALALLDRDAGLLRDALEAILKDHVQQLERRASPPPPVSELGAQLTAAAELLAIPVEVDARYEAWPVPVEGGRLPVDLLARRLRLGTS